VILSVIVLYSSEWFALFCPSTIIWGASPIYRFTLWKYSSPSYFFTFGIFPSPISEILFSSRFYSYGVNYKLCCRVNFQRSLQIEISSSVWEFKHSTQRKLFSLSYPIGKVELLGVCCNDLTIGITLSAFNADKSTVNPILKNYYPKTIDSKNGTTPSISKANPKLYLLINQVIPYHLFTYHFLFSFHSGSYLVPVDWSVYVT
jgi:hypothetical protein